jgi:putative ABC transport system permease protein
MLQDLRFAVRLLFKTPGTTLAAVLALALGIGLSTAIFNAFSAIMLRPFPYIRDEHRLVFLNSLALDRVGPGAYYELSMPDFLDIREQSKTLEGVTTALGKTVIFAGGEIPERVLGADISAEGFAMLGVQPVLGRVFVPADAQPGAPPVAILGYALWQRRFGGKADVIGRVETLNGAPTTIIGVLPAGFAFPENHELWTPLTYKNDPNTRGSHYLSGWARLRDGVSLDEARAELAALGARLAIAHKDTNEGKGFGVRLVREEATADSARLMQLMLGAALFVLLIACANVANLLLAKAAARSHEIAIRISVGATRGRILRQVFTESLLLGLLGGGCGLLAGVWGNSLLLRAVPSAHLPFWSRFDFDWRVFGFAAGAALGSSLLFGLFPALQASRGTSVELKEGGRGNTGGRRSRAVRHGLVVAQVALSTVLLIGAGLFVRSFLKLQSTPPGFDDRGVITFRVGLPPAQYHDQAEIRRFFAQLEPRLAEVPGVVAVGATSLIPSQGNNSNAFILEGQPMPKTLAESTQTSARAVSAGYFAALRIPLQQGRLFNASDTRESPRVAVVDQQFVRQWCHGVDPVGKRVTFGILSGDDPKWMTIVGVVGDVPAHLDQPYERGAIYQLSDQLDFNFISYAIRVSSDPTLFAPAIQRAVLAVKSDVPIYNVSTLAEIQALSYWNRRFFGQVFSVFGIGALFLAGLGVYGVIAYSVAQRIPEIGVRMALGATPGDVLRLVSRQGLGLVGLGLALGIAAALGLTRLMSGLLFGISATDPTTYAALATVLALVGLTACWLPARRAAKVDPLIALRSE